MWFVRLELVECICYMKSFMICNCRKLTFIVMTTLARRRYVAILFSGLLQNACGVCYEVVAAVSIDHEAILHNILTLSDQVRCQIKTFSH